MQRASPLSSEEWMLYLFSSRAACSGGVIRRKSRDIERFVGTDAFAKELQRRGFRAIENAGQTIIFCNHEPVRILV